MARTAKKKTAKRTTQKRNGTSAKTTAVPVKTNGFAVGDEVLLPEEDVSTLLAAEKRVFDLQIRLANLTEEYERRKVELLQAITKNREDYKTMVVVVGKKHEINLGPGSEQDWRYSPEKKVYQRIA